MRPSHPLPNVRDDRDTPLLWAGTMETVSLIWGKREAEYFCAKGWTAFRMRRFFCPSGKSLDVACREHLPQSRHCEERQRRSNPESHDEPSCGPWIASLALAMTWRVGARCFNIVIARSDSDEAIQGRLKKNLAYFAEPVIGSRNDGVLIPSSPSAPPHPSPRCSRSPQGGLKPTGSAQSAAR